MVHKHDNSLTIRLDPGDLNNALMREHFPLPTFEQITSQMAGACYFSVLDTSQGFWQIKLHESSTDYGTFDTPWGCYKFLRLPYGIYSTPEVFHRKFTKVFEGLPGVLTYIDDTICWGTSKDEHYEPIKAVMDRALKTHVRFNKHKCISGVQQVCYMAHIISARDLHPDATKVDAIHCMDVPTCKKDVESSLRTLHRYYGSSQGSLKKGLAWHWDHEQEIVFMKLKDLLCTTPVLKYYDLMHHKLVQLQSCCREGHPIAYASKSRTDIEQRCAQIEKEMLAIVFGAEHCYQLPSSAAENEVKAATIFITYRLQTWFSNVCKEVFENIKMARQLEEKPITGAFRVQTSKWWVKGAVIIRPANPCSYMEKMPNDNIVERSTKVLRPDKGVYLFSADRDDVDVVGHKLNNVANPISVNQSGRLLVERTTYGINNHDVFHTNGFHGFTKEDCRVRVHDISHNISSDTSVEAQGYVNPVVDTFVDSGGDGAPITSKFGR
ncbi:hypothetical protein PR048_006206, partial [Dryococelus australis]